MKSRLEVAAMMSQDIATPENPNGLWAKRYVMDKVFNMDDDEYQELRNMIADEVAEMQANGVSGGDTGEQTQDQSAPAPVLS